MPVALQLSEIKSAAKEAIKAKPTMKIVGMLDFNPPIYKQKVFKVKCLDCNVVELRDLYWLSSDWGCMCQRGNKISSTSLMCVDTFLKRARFKQRKIELLSEYLGKNKKVDVKCLVCDHEWSAFANNLQKGSGCPKCAPGLKKKMMLKKHGVEFSVQRPEVKAKIRKTMKVRYGCYHALQNRKLFDKMVYSSFATKSYKLGQRTVKVQGFEPQALDYIQNIKSIHPSKIECGLHNKKMPHIEFLIEGQVKVYHPDIFIPHLNLIVEVKSEYTFQLTRDETRIKKTACRKAGYRFKLLVMSRAGELLHEY